MSHTRGTGCVGTSCKEANNNVPTSLTNNNGKSVRRVHAAANLTSPHLMSPPLKRFRLTQDDLVNKNCSVTPQQRFSRPTPVLSSSLSLPLSSPLNSSDLPLSPPYTPSKTDCLDLTPLSVDRSKECDDILLGNMRKSTIQLMVKKLSEGSSDTMMTYDQVVSLARKLEWRAYTLCGGSWSDYSKLTVEKMKHLNQNPLQVRHLLSAEVPCSTLESPPEQSIVSPSLESNGDKAFFTAMASVWRQFNEQFRDSLPKSVDLLQLKVKLAKCSDPWGYIREILTTIDNAKTRCKKGKPSYNICVKIGQMFLSHFIQVMHDLNYCCGIVEEFKPKPLTCNGKKSCLVKVGESYYCCDDRCSSVYCTNCFRKIHGVVHAEENVDDEEEIFIIDSIQKSQFTLCKNNISTPEPVIKCVKCAKSHHKICVRHLEKISPEFICGSCSQPSQEINNPPRAKDLPETKLSCAIERRVNSYLEQVQLNITIKVRVVATVKKFVKVKPEMTQTFPEMPRCFPYTVKAIYAFFEKDDEDICFFGLHVQEYGRDCPAPNRGRVYIAYLDSVNYFQPKENRSAVYKEIVLGYLDHVRKLGYSFVHLWVCPPNRVRSDYLFHAHPPEQKFPQVTRLEDWYKSLSEKGKDAGVMMEFENVTDYIKQANITSPSQLPCFDGDIWLTLVENAIKKVHESDKEAAAGEPAKELKIANNLKGKPAAFTTAEAQVWNLLMKQIEKKDSVIYVARLNSQNDLVPDPDCFIECKLMEQRTNFIDHCRQMQLEFSSERRAKYSTMAMINEILAQLKVFCNNCNAHIQIRSERVNLSLCIDCYTKHKCFQRILTRIKEAATGVRIEESEKSI